MDLADSSHLCFRRKLFAATHGGGGEQTFQRNLPRARNPAELGLNEAQDANRSLLSVEGLEVATLQCMDEKVDILDSRGEKTGEVAWKSEAHRLGLWHRCFHCWIFSPGIPSGGPYLFVQRRAAGKDTWPNRLDVTAAGHLGAGEETLAGGLRGIEEGLGLTGTP